VHVNGVKTNKQTNKTKKESGFLLKEGLQQCIDFVSLLTPFGTLQSHCGWSMMWGAVTYF
jgi:hypothetical protein